MPEELNMSDTHSIDETVDAVDKRNLWRRAEDVRRNLIVIGLSAALVAGGIAWGTAAAAMSQKVDRSEFQAHVSDDDKRFIADSIRSEFQREQLTRIETKIDAQSARADSIGRRLSRLICEKGPAYCQ